MGLVTPNAGLGSGRRHWSPPRTTPSYSTASNCSPIEALQVIATCGGKARNCVAIKRGGLDCDARQVDEDLPQIAALREAGVNRCDITVGVKYIFGHGLEVVDKGQIYLGVSEIWSDVGDDGTGIGTDKVVLLSVAVKERWLWLWTAERRQSFHETLNVSRKVHR